MTSGLPPAAALPRRAGTLVPASAAAAVSLPVWLVFVGTVLLSVVRGTAEFVRVRAPVGHSRRRTPTNRPLAGHGKPPARQGAEGDPPWARRRGTNAGRPTMFPSVSNGLVPRSAHRLPPPPPQRGSGTPARGNRSAPCPG